MRKTARIGLLVTLLLSLGNPVSGVAAKPQKTPPPAALTGPTKVVWDYYAAYLAYLQNDFKKEDKTAKPAPDRSLDPGFVTAHFVASYQKLKAECDRLTPKGEVGPLDYDVIICAQDFPDSMAGSNVIVIKDTGTEASVRLGMGGFTPPAPPVIVNLKQEKKGWRIDAVLCNGQDFEALYKDIKKDQTKQKK
ncbi:MAG: DUF3828 domain-containing protein [Syntrophobacteraceae bacterium]|nr:DUF3828 domain-containing protein [Syntrophobacteraceae bacterium]